MFQFIVYLRAICAMIITNAHYEDIYPVSIIANGGLLGDVLFFAISGYCIYNIKDNFIKWYGKRIQRIYPAVWIITVVYLVLGFYHAGSGKELFELLIYPTYYHFVASIMVLYIIYYVIIFMLKRFGRNRSRLLKLYMVVVFGIYDLIYLINYDKSYYHIDSVYEPLIRFLFLESMLLGAWFREKSVVFTAKIRKSDGIGTVVLFGIYFASKLMFSRYELLAPYQILNQIVLFGLLFYIFRLFAGMERYYEKLPKVFRIIANNVSGITLEIYLVQYALISRLNILGFPVNFILVTMGIWITAMILNKLSSSVVNGISNAVRRKEK